MLGEVVPALNKRSDLTRASWVALISSFLVPPKQTSPQQNCSHCLFPSQWVLNSLTYPRKMTSAALTLNCFGQIVTQKHPQNLTLIFY